MYGDFDEGLLAQWCELYDRFVTKDRQRLAGVVGFCRSGRLDEYRLTKHNISQLLAKPTLDDDDYLSAYGCLYVLDKKYGHKPHPSSLNGFVETSLNGARYILTHLTEHPIAKAVPKTKRFKLNAELGANAVLGLRHQWQAVERSAELEMSRSDVFDELMAKPPKQLKIGLSPFSGIDDMLWRYDAEDEYDGRIPFWCDGAQDEQGLWERLSAVLIMAYERQVHILLLPELVMTEALQTRLGDWLAQHNSDKPIIRLVVAGTRHVIHGNGRNAYSNRCAVLNYCGGVEWEQEKRQRFDLDVEQADGLFGIQRSAFEPTRLSRQLVMRRTALGRMATPICLDFLCDGLWQVMPVDVYLVPVMSAGLSRFNRRCQTVGECGAAAFGCNVRMDGGWQTSMFAYRPAKDQLEPKKQNPYLFTVDVDMDMNYNLPE